MPTLQDVAKRAGVSTATVSKVLSNKPYFTEATRDKVMRAVTELGYVPHLAARALSSGKTHIIAVVFPSLYETIMTDPLVLRILEGIEAECGQRGYNMLLSTPRVMDRESDANYQQLISSNYLDGIIALDHIPFASVIGAAKKRGLPAVAIGYRDTPYSVQSDDFSGGMQLMQHVAGKGHRQIGIIAVPNDEHLPVQHRIAGLQAGAEQFGIVFDDLPRMDGDFSTHSGSRAASELLVRNPQLTALICLNDRMAMGAIHYARQVGRSIPDDLTIVGYDDIPLAAAFSPGLTTIDQQAPQLGQAAARMLMEVLAGKKPEPVKLPTYLVVRQSSAALKLLPERG